MSSFKSEYFEEGKFHIGEFVWRSKRSDEIPGQPETTHMATCTLTCAICGEESKKITPRPKLGYLTIECPKCENLHSVKYSDLSKPA